MLCFTVQTNGPSWTACLFTYIGPIGNQIYVLTPSCNTWNCWGLRDCEAPPRRLKWQRGLQQCRCGPAAPSVEDAARDPPTLACRHRFRPVKLQATKRPRKIRQSRRSEPASCRLVFTIHFFSSSFSPGETWRRWGGSCRFTGACTPLVNVKPEKRGFSVFGASRAQLCLTARYDPRFGCASARASCVFLLTRR